MRALDILTLASCILEAITIVLAFFLPDSDNPITQFFMERIFSILSLLFLILPILFIVSKALQGLALMYPNT